MCFFVNGALVLNKKWISLIKTIEYCIVLDITGFGKTYYNQVIVTNSRLLKTYTTTCITALYNSIETFTT